MRQSSDRIELEEFVSTFLMPLGRDQNVVSCTMPLEIDIVDTNDNDAILLIEDPMLQCNSNDLVNTWFK